MNSRMNNGLKPNMGSNIKSSIKKDIKKDIRKEVKAHYNAELDKESNKERKSDKKTGFRSDKKTTFKTEKKTSFKSDRKASFKTDKKVGSKTDKKSFSTKSKNENYVKAASKSTGCPFSKQCGACNYQEGKYHFHLKEKQKIVDKLMKPYCSVQPIIGMENPLHYRNKVHATFDRTKKGVIVAGTYEAKTHNIIPIENCMIENEEADQIINDIKNMLKSFKIKTYDEDTGYGLFRRVLVRTAKKTGEIMVVLVLGSPIMPSKNNFVKALRKLHPNITTVIVNVNDKRTSMILGDKEQVIYGKGFIVDELCGLKFRISSKSFYQVNPNQTEILYKKAMKFAELSGKEKVIDAYCGIGTIGMIASKNAKEVIGVELNKDAVRDAVTNAKKNEIHNIRFVNKDAGEFMTEMAEQGEHADVVFMDPPRAGSDEAFLSSVIKLAPEKIVYISCNPETLERDVKFLSKKGYEVKKVQPVDMFPWTEHVETVCALNKTN